MQVLPPNPVPAPAPVKPPKQSVTSDGAIAPIPVEGPLPSKPPLEGLVRIGINANIDDINNVVAQVDAGHRKLFGHSPSPGLIFDVTRGHAQGKVPSIPGLFQIPTTPMQAQVKTIAGKELAPLTPAVGGAPVDPSTAPKGKSPLASGLRVAQRAGVDLSHLSATDAGAAAAIVAAQGHPLTPQQQVALGVAQGKLTPLEAQKHLQVAGVIPSFKPVMDGGGIFGYLFAGAYEFGTGLVVGVPMLAYQEVEGTKKSIEQGSISPIAHANAVMGKALVKGTYDDAKAIATGDMPYLRAHPSAIWNIGFLAAGGLGPATKLSRAAAAGEGERFAALTALPPPKTLSITGDRSAAAVDALNFENPLLRWADNVVTNKRAVRYAAGKEVIGAGALRAVNLQHAADFLDRNFSYASKFRRESEALNRARYEMTMYLARQLDHISSPAIDATSALHELPVTAGKNELSIGELKAIQVIAQGGDWQEALGTMRTAHIDWRDAAESAGAPDQAAAHQSQLTALKLAQQTLESLDRGEARPIFRKALPLINAALDKSQEIKIDKLGLDPETAYARNPLEYDIYKKGTTIPDRKKLANLIKGTQTHVDRLTEKGGYVTPELTAAKDAAQARLEAATEPDEIVKATRAVKAADKKIAAARAQDHPEFAAASSRLASLKDTMANIEERIQNAERRPGQRRLPLSRRPHQITGGVGSDFPRRSQNLYGEFRPAGPAELNHAFTGSSLVSGDIRLDFVNTIAKELASSVRAAFRLDDYTQKMKTTVARPPEGPLAQFYAPMRKTETIPEKWRKLVSGIKEPGLSEDDLAALTDDEVEGWHDAVYGAKQRDDGTWDFKGAAPKDYVWYDRRAFSESRDISAGTEGMQKFFQTAYNVIGRPRIFLAPRYLLYTLSNKAMLATHAHFWTPAALAASHFAHRIYDSETVDRIDIAMGSSRSRSYGPKLATEDVPTKVMTSIANAAHKITDQNDRRAAFIHYAWRKGYRSAEQMKDLVTNDKNAADYSEVKRYAEKSMVELGNLTWAEQQYLQHMIFVYPWRSRQFLWSVRTLAEHPGQSAILSMIGQDGLHDELANKPLWIQSAIKKYIDYGYIITGWNPDGSPKGMDAGALNTFSGLDEIMHPDLTGSLGPGAQVGVEAFTGRDSRGRDFGGSFGHKLWSAFTDVAIGTQPLALAKGRADKKDPALPAFNPADRQTEIKRMKAANHIVALTPGWLHGFGMLFSGSVTTRTFQRQKLLYNYYQGLTPDDRHAFEKKLILNVLGVQGSLLKQSVPDNVRTAVTVSSDLSYRLFTITHQKGYTGGVPEVEHDQELIATLKDHGLISDADAAKYDSLAAHKGALPADHSQLRSFLMNKYAGGKDLQLWDDHVKLLASYTALGIKGKMSRLNAAGLAAGTAPSASQDALYEVGRKVVAYETKVRAFDQEIRNEPDPVRKTKLKAAYDAYENAQDTPIKAGGKTFPSAPRLSYADTSEKDRAAHLVAKSTSKWSSMSNLDKELLAGKTIDPIVSNAWAAINERMAEEKARLQPGQHLPSGLRNYYVQKVASQSPAFRADVAFGDKTTAERMLTYKPIRSSQYASQWRTVLQAARDRAKQYIKAGYVTSSGKPDWAAIQSQWVKNDLPAVEQFISKQSAGFQADLKRFTDHSPVFLHKLVRP